MASAYGKKCMGVAGRRRLVAQPGGLTSGFAVHLVIDWLTVEHLAILTPVQWQLVRSMTAGKLPTLLTWGITRSSLATLRPPRSTTSAADACNTDPPNFTDKTVLSLVPRLAAWRYPRLLLSAGARRRHRSKAADSRRILRQLRLSIDIPCLHRAQQPTSRRRMLLLLSIDGTDWPTDGRTDGRTHDGYIDHVPHGMWVSSINY